jgi:hypothetical protein
MTLLSHMVVQSVRSHNRGIIHSFLRITQKEASTTAWLSINILQVMGLLEVGVRWPPSRVICMLFNEEKAIQARSV